MTLRTRNVALALALAALLLAACAGPTASAPTSWTTTQIAVHDAADVVLTHATVAAYFDVGSAGTIVAGSVNASGDAVLALPGSLPAAALQTDLFQGCSGLTIDPANPKLFAAQDLRVTVGDVQLGTLVLHDPGDPPSTGDGTFHREAWIFADGAVSAQGSCSDWQSSGIAATFDLHLEPGWNLVQATVTASGGSLTALTLTSAATPANYVWTLVPADAHEIYLSGTVAGYSGSALTLRGLPILFNGAPDFDVAGSLTAAGDLSATLPTTAPSGQTSNDVFGCTTGFTLVPSGTVLAGVSELWDTHYDYLVPWNATHTKLFGWIFSDRPAVLTGSCANSLGGTTTLDDLGLAPGWTEITYAWNFNDYTFEPYDPVADGGPIDWTLATP